MQCPPIAQQGWHNILTVFPIMVCSPTWSNSYARMLNAHFSAMLPKFIRGVRHWHKIMLPAFECPIRTPIYLDPLPHPLLPMCRPSAAGPRLPPR